MVSQFTRRLLDRKPSFDFVAAHFACEKNKYSPSNPRGYVNLGSAQNFLCKEEVAARLDSFKWNSSDTPYCQFSGTDSCRGAIAGYLQELSGRPIDPNHVVVGNGLISVLEALSIAILDPGDSVLVSTPIFPGLVTSLVSRTDAEVVYWQASPEESFRLTPSGLGNQLLEQQEAGKSIKAVLLCSPGNPVGQVFTPDEIQAFVEVARQFDIALIFDEIYASSCFEGVDFFSAVSVDDERVFVIGGMSKDFGLAGYATAWIHTSNASILPALQKQSHYFRLSAPIQRSIEWFLDPEWRRGFSKQNQKRLTQNYQQTCDALSEIDIPVTPSQSGLVCWLDLRSFLVSQDEEGQIQLYRYLLEHHRVHISPGSGFHFSQAGFFRICFSQDHETLREGLRRIQQGLQQFQTECLTDLDKVAR